MPPEEPGADWRRHELAIGLVAVLGLSLLVHLVLLPSPGYVRDLDEFASWIHRIAVGGVTHAYDERLSYPPAMVYLWGALGALAPIFRVATDSADLLVRIVMKTPATIADLGLAAGVAWYLRRTPRWAILGAASIALNPAILLDTAWWGQVDSIYALGALVAYLLAVSGRRDAAAIALGITLMTKPQAFPVAVAMGAHLLGRYGTLGLVRATVVSAATAVLLWLPFLPTGGAANYAASVAEYQGTIFPYLSVHAWNAWSILQSAAGGGFVSDATPLLGPFSARMLGYAMAGVLELAVFIAVARDPSPRRLAIGTAAGVLVAFAALTSMHERYAFVVLVPLALLVRERAFRRLGLLVTALMLGQLLGAVDGPVGDVFRSPAVSIPGSVLMLAATVASCALLLRSAPIRPEVSERTPDARIVNENPLTMAPRRG
jgi:dolichyl-phosphate-mannose-protein mannosyltransferase